MGQDAMTIPVVLALAPAPLPAMRDGLAGEWGLAYTRWYDTERAKAVAAAKGIREAIDGLKPLMAQGHVQVPAGCACHRERKEIKKGQPMPWCETHQHPHTDKLCHWLGVLTKTAGYLSVEPPRLPRLDETIIPLCTAIDGPVSSRWVIHYLSPHALRTLCSRATDAASILDRDPRGRVFCHACRAVVAYTRSAPVMPPRQVWKAREKAAKKVKKKS